jgi:hypothetical protein
MTDDIVERRRDASEFESLLDRTELAAREGDALTGSFGRRYYPEVFGGELVDTSFAVLAASGSGVVVECDILHGVIGRFGNPLRMLPFGEPNRAKDKAVSRALAHLKVVAESGGADRALVADPDSGATLSDVGVACAAADAVPRPRFVAVVDLSPPEDVLRADVRRRYRSMINRGQRELSMEYCNAEHPDHDVFSSYQEFHKHVAGRVTRPPSSWDVMFSALSQGAGELSVARLDGKVVAGTMVIDGHVTCSYASGAYERESFDRPLAHWPMMNAILRARARSLRYFDVGEVLLPPDRSEKERSIAFFKRGFTSRIESRLVWEIAFA